ncbi:Uncharacterized protein HZ326_27434 [Fusarium oxysporum f. sp. albedinis]|nr:Uncharacterized protein HZ326_27434 [Fusarium oxysporum f. sp. albedinis]
MSILKAGLLMYLIHRCTRQYSRLAPPVSPLSQIRAPEFQAAAVLLSTSFVQTLQRACCFRAEGASAQYCTGRNLHNHTNGKTEKNRRNALQASRPTIFGLVYYPVHATLNEWNTYTRLIRRYFKYCECSMSGITHRFHSDDIVDLQRWHQEADQKPKDMITKDLRSMQRQMELHSQSLSQMVIMAISMFQILNSRRPIPEAINIRRLKYIALV